MPWSTLQNWSGRLRVKIRRQQASASAGWPALRCRPALRKCSSASSAQTEGDIVNCESDPGELGSLSVSSYSTYFMRAIHYVPLGPPQQGDMGQGGVAVEDLNEEPVDDGRRSQETAIAP